MNVSAYITKLRMRRASYQLAFRSESKVIDIALDNGYESAEAFSRAFKRSTKQSPSSFKKSPDCFPWHENNNPLTMLRKFRMQNSDNKIEVNIKNIEAIKIAVLEHRGAPELLGQTIRKFIAWRKENKLPPSISRTFNLVYDDPAMVTADQYRFDLCAEIKSELQENDFGIISKLIPSGRCAVIRHIGSDENMADAIQYLYGEWLEENNEELRDFPLSFERVTFFPDVPEHKMITDIYLPIK